MKTRSDQWNILVVLVVFQTLLIFILNYFFPLCPVAAVSLLFICLILILKNQMSNFVSLNAFGYVCVKINIKNTLSCQFYTLIKSYWSQKS